MHWTFIALLLTMLAAAPAPAQEWKKELLRPLVKVVGATMRLEESELCTFEANEEGSDPLRLQVRTRSEAPAAGLISRDNFVAFSAVLSLQALESLGDPDCKTTSAVIGTPDLDINLIMTPDGLQIEVKDTLSGQTSRETTLWKQLFDE